MQQQHLGFVPHQLQVRLTPCVDCSADASDEMTLLATTMTTPCQASKLLRLRLQCSRGGHNTCGCSLVRLGM